MPIMDWINFTYHQGWANNSCQSESPSSSPTIHLNCQRRFYSLANSLCLKEPFSCSLVCIMLKTPFFPCKVTSPRIVSIRQQYHLMWQEQKWSSQSLNLMFGIYIFVMVNFLKDVVCHSAGATTNSQHGGFGKCLPVVEEMVQQNMPLLVHGEVTSLDVDVFDREKVFIEEDFSRLIQKCPRVKRTAFAGESAAVFSVKLYPAGATANSQHGVFGKCLPVVEEMVQQNMPLLVRGEVTSLDVDVFDLEKVFIEEVFSPLIQKFPRVKVVMEHITTKDAVNFVESCDDGK
ncbi:dihydroorotase, mitochondrial isoform X1 [Olea europaea subsp. europaea]|nr:dihydroorotase, mitochondrial isoform X1 [Olea europaea subsp. europaea]